MDFKEIFEKWEKTKAAKKSRFSHIIAEKEAGLYRGNEVEQKKSGYLTGRSSLGKLRSMRSQDKLDLHGYTSEEARRAIKQFLEDSVAQRLQKVMIVHGRGLHSIDGKGVIRDVVRDVLDNSPLVRDYGNPRPVEGGSGAVWVILQRGRAVSARGK
ncbi:MAG: Smr/MutS family protein [Spirochaetales bacterium]|jgi:DNA-nicking Smr family endonuclease|nr:Smr/MutS family protein [Spirochaetales bacterium]